jgi:hypothetical protein
MKNITVTKALRDSIKKITKQSDLGIFSDTRDNKKAVGVKIRSLCGFQPSKQLIEQIINDMESKGFEFKYLNHNKGGAHGGWSAGIRFCFYKLQYSNIK